MTTPTPNAGWYPDPAGGGGLRWWDGGQWTSYAQASAPPPPPPPAGGASWGYRRGGRPPHHYGGGTGGGTPGIPVGGTLWQRNQYSFITGIIVVVYLGLAVVVHFALIGLFPLLMSVRAMRRKEQLAPVALGLAIVSIVAGLALYRT